MFRYLCLENVGPSPQMEMELSPRLNIITGDNGLGKSFLLDVIWWALTRTWPHELNRNITSGYPARPTDIKKPAHITFRLDSKTVSDITYKSKYEPREQAWIGKSGRPWNPGLVIYAHADGGFSVWDPARNYWKKKGNIDIQDRFPGYVFSARDVWDGLEVEVDSRKTVVCNGLIRDWASWIRENGSLQYLMSGVLKDLSPMGEPIKTGPLTRISINDGRDIPTIRTSYAEAVPILHASAGIRRVLGLAYMLVWLFLEHRVAAKSLGEFPTNRIVMLVDEIESHLHPKWQRTILRSILSLIGDLGETTDIQLITATHSPLVLAGAEPLFDPDKDSWFDLDLEPQQHQVILQKRPFVRQGTAGRWLTSEAFGFASEGRSVEAEEAIAAASALLDRRRSGENLTQAEIDATDAKLRATLAEMDLFWIRWSAAIDEIRQGSVP